MIGPALRTHRERLGLTQRELAERAGVHYTYIHRAEHDAFRPSLARVRQLIAGLDEKAELDLLTAAGYYEAPDSLADETLREIDRQLERISPARRRALLRAFDILTRIA